MAHEVSVSRERGPSALTNLLWARPEWWCFGVALAAWAMMLSHVIAHCGHAHHHLMTVGQEIEHWTAMIAAMMLPLTVESVRVTAFRSLWSRRYRAMVGFAVGYFVPWVVAGLPVVLLRQLPMTHTHAAAAVAFVLAAAWVWFPQRKRALARCHRTIPLSPRGLAADLDCLRFGALIGAACVVTCWPLMLACTLTGHGLFAMLAGSAIGALERLSFRPRTRTIFATTLAVSGFYGVLALVA